MKSFESDMKRIVTKNLITYAASRAIFCPGTTGRECGSIMDQSRTVIIGDSAVLCAACFDAAILPRIPPEVLAARKESGFIVDGRDYFPQKRTRKAKA